MGCPAQKRRFRPHDLFCRAWQLGYRQVDQPFLEPEHISGAHLDVIGTWFQFKRSIPKGTFDHDQRDSSAPDGSRKEIKVAALRLMPCWVEVGGDDPEIAAWCIFFSWMNCRKCHEALVRIGSCDRSGMSLVMNFCMMFVHYWPWRLKLTIDSRFTDSYVVILCLG